MLRHNAEGSSLAIRYLQAAVAHGATNPADFAELAELLVKAERLPDAMTVLRQGMQLDPHDVAFYQLGAKVSFAQNKIPEGCEVADKGVQKFPQDEGLRSLMNRCDTAPAK